MADNEGRLRVPGDVYVALGYLFPRLLFLNTRYAPQVHWGDIAAALDGFPADDLDLSSAGFWNNWRERWTAQAGGYVELAHQSGTRAGRARAMRSAAACYHWAEFQYFDDPDLKRQLRRQIRDRFLNSLDGSDLDVAPRRLPGRQDRPEVPYWLVTTHAMRAAGTPLPAVVLSNGLDSATEIEIMALAEAYLDRGIAAVIFEGPGQGVNLGQTPLRFAMEEVVADLVAALAAEPTIAADRLAFVGISFGGYIALRVADALGDSFRCVVNFGGGPSVGKFAGLPRRLKDNFRFAFQLDKTADLQPLFDRFALEPGRPPATDVWSIHGALDDIFPVEGLADLDRAWGPRHRLEVHPREAHTSLNVINADTLRAADWVADRLTADGRGDSPDSPASPG